MEDAMNAPLKFFGGTIIPLSSMLASEADPDVVALVHYKVIQINPTKITVKCDGQNVPNGCIPIPGVYPQSKFDIKLDFITAFVPGKLVEFLFEIASDVDMTFWNGWELTGASTSSSLLKRIVRPGDGVKKTRMVVGKATSADEVISYNIGVLFPEGDGYYMQQHWDPKIKNHG